MNCILKLYFKNTQSMLMAAWSIFETNTIPFVYCATWTCTIVFKGKFRVSLSHQDRSDQTASAFSSWRRQLRLVWLYQLRSIDLCTRASLHLHPWRWSWIRLDWWELLHYSVCNESCAQGGQDVWCHWTGHTVAAFSSHLMWWVIEICIILGMLLVTSILLCARTGFIHF